MIKDYKSEIVNHNRYDINNFNEIEYFEEDIILNSRDNVFLYNKTRNKIIKNSNFYHNNDINKLNDVIEYIEYCLKINSLIKENNEDVNVAILDEDLQFLYLPVEVFKRLALIRSISFIDSINSISTEMFEPVLLDNERELSIKGLETKNPLIESDTKFIDIKGENILSEIIYYMTSLEFLEDKDGINSLTSILEEIYSEIVWLETSKVFIQYLDGLKYAISFKGFKKIYGGVNLYELGD